MEFNTLLITDKSQLKQYKEQILELFSLCFATELESSVWDWAYIDNPCGEPIVSLYFHENKLVGHYAVVPFQLTHHNSPVKSVLSMTTMVAPNCRGQGLFVRQASEVYQKAIELNYQLVFGFPNKNSAPGFRKRLDWTIVECLVCSFDGVAMPKFKEENYQNSIRFDITNKELVDWRLSKPGNSYITNGNNIFKKYNEEIDVLYFSGAIDNIGTDEIYNVLLSDHDTGLSFRNSFEYKFGYRFFDQAMSNYKFKKDLIMSDVF